MKPDLVDHIQQRANQETQDGSDGEDDVAIKK